MRKRVILSTFLAMATVGVLAGCSNQIGKSAEPSSNVQESESSQAAQLSADEEEEAWKKEPAYGQTIKIGFNGGLCLGAFGIA